MISKQQAILISRPLPRITICHGTISSGKTWAANTKSLREVGQRRGQPGLVLFAGRTLKTLEANVLMPLQQMYGKQLVQYSLSKKRAIIGGEPVELEGCNDAQAEYKIRGWTLKFVYLDELTLLNREFVTRCLGGLRAVHDAPLLATTNPDAPGNFVKTDFLDREGELNSNGMHLRSMFFDFEDNPSLSTQYKEFVRNEYTGVLYERFILGQWRRAAGLVYGTFADNTESFLIDKKDVPRLQVINIGVDFGGSGSGSAFITVGFSMDFKQVIILDEEYRDAHNETPTTLSKAFSEYALNVIDEYDKVPRVYADSAEQVLIRGLREEIRKYPGGTTIGVKNAIKSKINERIHLINMLMGSGRFFICRHCTETIEALQEAVYDEKAEQDTRLDDGSYNMDVIDALEYGIEPFEAHLWRGARHEQRKGIYN